MFEIYYLEIEVETFAQIDFFGETFIFPHVKGQRIISIGIFAFRKKHGVIETNKFTSRHPLINEK